MARSKSKDRLDLTEMLESKWGSNWKETVFGIAAYSILGLLIIGAFAFFVIKPKYVYSHSTPYEKCQIDLKKYTDDDHFCDDNYKVQSRQKIAEQEAKLAEEARRASLSPYDRCVEDRENASQYNEDGGFTVCNQDGTTKYISESEIEADISNEKSVSAGASNNCNPNYSPCVPNASYDLDCPDIGFSVNVIGSDVYGFDRDGDGYGCEAY